MNARKNSLFAIYILRDNDLRGRERRRAAVAAARGNLKPRPFFFVPPVWWRARPRD